MPCTCMSLQQIWSSGCSRQQGAALRGAGARHSGSWLCSLTNPSPIQRIYHSIPFRCSTSAVRTPDEPSRAHVNFAVDCVWSFLEPEPYLTDLYTS